MLCLLFRHTFPKKGSLAMLLGRWKGSSDSPCMYCIVCNVFCHLIRQRHGEPDSVRYCNEVVTAIYCILSVIFNQLW